MTAPIQALLMTGTPRDPYFADVVALLHFDGTVGATTYTNNGSGGNFSNTGTDPALSATQVKFGTTSLHYTASSAQADCTVGSYQFGTSDFTIEYWVYLGSLLSVFLMIDFRNAGNQVAPAIYGDSGGKLYYYVNGVNVISSAASALTTGAWHFVALSRVSSSSKLFLDGTQVGSTYADSNNFNVVNRIGVGSNFNGSQPCNGSYIDEVRVTNGVGRYTSNFSNPTTPFPNH